MSLLELKRTLYCLFSAYGKVISIIATKTRQGRGQAFIAFSDIVSATTALRGLQGFTIYGKSMVRDLSLFSRFASLLSLSLFFYLGDQLTPLDYGRYQPVPCYFAILICHPFSFVRVCGILFFLNRKSNMQGANPMPSPNWMVRTERHL